MVEEDIGGFVGFLDVIVGVFHSFTSEGLEIKIFGVEVRYGKW